MIATKIGIALDQRDIVSIHRTGSKNSQEVDESKGPRIAVLRLARRSIKEDILKAAKTRRGGIKSSDLNIQGVSRIIHINERLTYVNRQLFRNARLASKEHGWKFVWTREGRVLARHSEGKAVHRIKTEDDINQVFRKGNM
ncbi:hypothetical protein O0L34_g17869 [Tuta absoluta]|nr:hypothetical protein O0L34_g17869 [Tuta absoluta]